MPVFKRTAIDSNGNKSLPERDEDSTLITTEFSVLASFLPGALELPRYSFNKCLFLLKPV